MEMNELMEKAMLGDLASIETVAESYFLGKNGFEENNEQALKWYQKALEIDPNNKTALTGLGSIYYEGFGVPVNEDKGIAYYKKAAESGSGTSACRLGDHFKNLRDPQCISWYERAFNCGEVAAAYELSRIYADDGFVATDIAKRLEWLAKGAEANVPECQVDLACEYLPNGNLKQDDSLVFKWMLAAAKNGNATAMNNLAIMYTKGQIVDKNYDVALEWAIKAAKNGDASQLNRYALFYQDGDGFLPHIPEKAIELFGIGVDAGDSNSMTYLGNAYLKGIGVEADEAKALSLFESAAKQGNEASLNMLKILGPRIYGEDAPAKYFEVVKDGADNGYYICMVRAYQSLSTGDGVPRNSEAALKYLKKAANDDYKEAVYYLGTEHLGGKLIEDADPQIAAQLFEKVIAIGKPDATTAAAQRSLGLMYKEGVGVDRDLDKAIAYLESAAENGNADALLQAALAHEDDGWADLDFEKACKYYTILDEAGYTIGTTCLAVNYARGTGVPKDLMKAVELYKKAIQQGDTRAMTNLAYLYQNEEAVGKDEKRAIELLTEAAKQGYEEAEVRLGFAYYEGNGVPSDLGEALRLWEAAAEQGNMTARKLVGKAYADKSFKSVINYEKSVAFFRPMAEQGDAEAAYHLAGSLEEIQAWDEAKAWYVKAAEGGNIDAQVNLGISAWLEEKYTDAVKWLQPAAEQGNASAMCAMAEMLLFGNSAIARDEKKAIQYYTQSAEQRHLRAMYQLGRCYYFGYGVPTDYDKAFNLFSELAGYGSNDMWAELGKCYQEGNGVGKNVDEAVKCYKLGIERTNSDFCRMFLGTIYADKNSGYFNRNLAEECLIPMTNKDSFRNDAVFKLGVACRSDGDIQKAVHWFSIGAENNDSGAQYLLGAIYFTGELGTCDIDKAEQYFTMAARNGNSEAASALDSCRSLREQMQTRPQQTAKANSSSTPQQSGGCYVATAVYGSYDCPEVWTLRRFRDYSLAETWYGRLFILFYYAISPTLVRIFGNCKWFKNLWKPILDRMAKKLRCSGFADTPYNDRKF